MASNSKPKVPAKESPTEPFKRAVGGCLRAIARKGELEVSFAAERPGLMGGKVRLPEPPRKLGEARGRDRARPCRFHRAQARLSRSRRASPPAAGRPAGARGVRGGRAGARRGHRRPPHGRRRAEPRRHARRALSPRQVRPDHRARRRADRRSAVADGARAPDRRGPAGGGQEAGRSLAAADRGARRPRSRPARRPARRPAPVRRRHSRPARLAGDGRRPLLRFRGRGRGRRGPQPAAVRRGRRVRRVRRHAALQHGGLGGFRRGHARRLRRGGRGADLRHGRRQRDGRRRNSRRAAAAAPVRRQRSRAARTIAPSRSSSTRRSRPKTCASRKSSSGCAAISTSSFRICRAWWRASPTACNAG